jgi:hypothetical protein
MLIDLVGKEFGQLTVVALVGRRGNNTYWQCQCHCGEQKTVRGSHLKSGGIKSCGCLRGHPTHGEGSKGQETAEYSAWLGMRKRCQNSKCQDWPDYGGRGIKVCERWQIYTNFLADMGRRPSPKHSLDRIDNDGDYEPSNCRWATPKEQYENRRVKFIEAFSDTELIAELRRRNLHWEPAPAGSAGTQPRSLIWHSRFLQ